MDPEKNQTSNALNNTPLANPVPEEEKVERTPIKSLRTYQGDVQEVMSKNNTSTTTVFVAEQKRKLENPTPEVSLAHSKARNKTFIVFGTTFILLGIASVGILYYWKSHEKIIVEQKTKTLIAFSEERKISIQNLHKDEFVAQFNENLNSWRNPVNSVLYLNPFSDGQPIETQYLLTLIGPNMPPSLSRSFGDKYMLGIYSFDTNEPFIILTVDDYSLSYPGMLKWENDIANNLGVFFGIQPEVGTTTRSFIDESIKNKDIRALKDADGNSLILYSFIDRNTLVIARNENILSAIVGKYIISKQIK